MKTTDSSIARSSIANLSPQRQTERFLMAQTIQTIKLLGKGVICQQLDDTKHVRLSIIECWKHAVSLATGVRWDRAAAAAHCLRRGRVFPSALFHVWDGRRTGDRYPPQPFLKLEEAIERSD